MELRPSGPTNRVDDSHQMINEDNQHREDGRRELGYKDGDCNLSDFTKTAKFVFPPRGEPDLLCMMKDIALSELPHVFLRRHHVQPGILKQSVVKGRE